MSNSFASINRPFEDGVQGVFLHSSSDYPIVVLATGSEALDPVYPYCMRSVSRHTLCSKRVYQLSFTFIDFYYCLLHYPKFASLVLGFTDMTTDYGTVARLFNADLARRLTRLDVAISSTDCQAPPRRERLAPNERSEAEQTLFSEAECLPV